MPRERSNAILQCTFFGLIRHGKTKRNGQPYTIASGTANNENYTISFFGPLSHEVRFCIEKGDTIFVRGKWKCKHSLVASYLANLSGTPTRQQLITNQYGSITEYNRLYRAKRRADVRVSARSELADFIDRKEARDKKGEQMDKAIDTLIKGITPQTASEARCMALNDAIKYLMMAYDRVAEEAKEWKRAYEISDAKHRDLVFRIADENIEDRRRELSEENRR